jgi:Uma2 family endonuclease
VVLYASCVLGRHPRPEEIFLLVEVADTSLTYDLGPKLTAYGQAGITEVWIIDAIRRRVLINRQPGRSGYEKQLEATVADTVTVEAFPDIIVPVSAFLR